MSWIVLGEKNGLVEMRSIGSDKSEEDGLLPIGSFLTLNNKSNDSKIVLRVEESIQSDPYSPTPLIAEMNLDGLIQDTKCYNIIKAKRIYHDSKRSDGKYEFIKARSIVERSSNDDIMSALHSSENGPRIFPATLFSGENSLIRGNDNEFLNIRLDDEIFWHQMIICGATGMGKTVAIKYLADHFVNELEGCVIALNVKDDDLLHMEKPSTTQSEKIKEEWKSLGISKPRGIDNFDIYHPFGDNYKCNPNIDKTRIHPITLRVSSIDPESLLGLLREQMTNIASRWFPDIFRYWQQENINDRNIRFIHFVEYFDNVEDNNFQTLDINGLNNTRRLPPQTISNMSRAISYAARFFDNSNAEPIQAEDFLERGKFSTIDLAGGENGIEFGSIFIRHILKEIKNIKWKYADLPILIVIDEAHKFHSTEQGTKEALNYLDDICRTGRSNKIGIIFASQDLATIPRGLINIVNTVISFGNSDNTTARKFGISAENLSSLDKGYAVATLHNIRNLKYIKFPLSIAGVIENER